MGSENQQNIPPTTTNPYEAIPYYDHTPSLSESPANVRREQTPAPPTVEHDTSSLTISRQPSHRWLPYSVVATIGAVILLVASAFFSTKLAPRVTKAPTSSPFHYAACPFHPGAGIVEGRELRCGFLIVPEDRGNAKSLTIQLAVAIYKAPGAQASTSPVVDLEGGPGGEALAYWGPYITLKNLKRITMGHDFIILDQRGTGYSRPFLGCHEVDDAKNMVQTDQSDGKNAGSSIVNAIRACHQRLALAGVNLQAYTTIENANDVHDLIYALGYKQVDLYGVSYGTRLALTVMRLFPGDVRSAVLDSVVPTQENLFKDTGRDTQRAFDVLFQGCATDRTCNNAYPHLADRFYQLVHKWNAQPITLFTSDHKPTHFSGDDLADSLFHAMYDTTLIPLLPKSIIQASRGDYTLVTQEANLSSDEAQDISFGMYYSVECGEDMDFLKGQDIMAAASAVNIELYKYTYDSLMREFTECQLWPQIPVPAVQKQPVVSSIPTLLLSGEYDPITPPDNGIMAARTLSNGYFLQFPATGHGVLGTNKCADMIVTAFLDNPNQHPNAQCITTMQEPKFE